MSVATQRTSNDLTGQVAIVTGGGRGLGRAFALALSAAGATAAVVARSADQLAETVAAIGKAGGRAMACAADVSDARAVEQMVKEVEKQAGPADLLLNGAGVAGPFGPAWETNPDEWWRCLEINLRGQYLCARAVLPGMLARRRGRIINVASGAGTMSIPYMSAYVTSKAALIRFTDVLAIETQDYGVSIFAIEPGTVRTAMAEYALASPAGQKWMPWFRKIFEEGRDVSPDVGARLVLLLASGKADALSGRFLTVSDDLASIIEQAEEIRRNDLYTLRLRKPT